MELLFGPYRLSIKIKGACLWYGELLLSYVYFYTRDSGASVPSIRICYKNVNKEVLVVFHSTVCKALTKLPHRDCRQYGDARCNGDNI